MRQFVQEPGYGVGYLVAVVAAHLHCKRSRFFVVTGIVCTFRRLHWGRLIIAQEEPGEFASATRGLWAYQVTQGIGQVDASDGLVLDAFVAEGNAAVGFLK